MVYKNLKKVEAIVIAYAVLHNIALNMLDKMPQDEPNFNHETAEAENSKNVDKSLNYYYNAVRQA